MNVKLVYMDHRSVSVVVPAYNCESTIARTITAIKNQSFKPKDIIIIDDGSCDGSAHTVKFFPEVKYVFQPNAGPAAARNKGAELAEGEVLFFTDSDCIPAKDWIEKMIQHFDRPLIGAVAGSYGIANADNRLARGIHNEILFRHDHLMPEYPSAFGSYNVAIRKSVFHQVGGFDESYRWASGEDNDLSYKLLKAGFKIYFERAAKVDHFHATSIFRYLKEQYRHGFWRVRLYMAHPDMVKGDNYTFWKDIIEMPLAFLTLVFLFFSVLPYGAAVMLLIVLLFNGFMQLIFSCMTENTIYDAIYYSFILFVRSYLRFFGLSTGICFFFFEKFSKKN
ncbi:MAG: glycosyltransferase [Candidatus Omnitrophica bacterium]|nr:glycosyltransferase [Candidatus Omnitrophota bacterium]